MSAILMEMEEKPEIKKVVLGIGIGLLVIGGIIYAGYAYSQKQGLKLTLPGGSTYTGNQPNFNTETPPTAPLRFSTSADTPWVNYQGKVYAYTFSYPQTLSLSFFPKDPSDSVAINWGNIIPENNILLNVESIKTKDPQYLGNTEEYARNWWKAFNGLKGVLSVEKLNTSNGLKGFRAVYINLAGQSPNVDVFLEIPGNQDMVIHLANGVLDPAIFNRIVDSVKYNPVTTATPTPTATE